MSNRQLEDYLSILKKSGLVRWNSMPITVYIEPTSKAIGFKTQYIEILKQSWLEWAEASSSKISCQFVSSPGRAQVLCQWTDDEKRLQLGDSCSAGGATRLAANSKGIANAEVRILTVPPSSINLRALSDDMMRQAFLHEVGHALGFSGHSDQSTDIMCSYVSNRHQRRSLSKRDINTLIALYSLDQSEIEKYKLDPQRAKSDPTLQASRLNNEAAAALAKADYFLAIAKLEEAQRIDPTNEVVRQNLAGAYLECAAKKLLTTNPVMATFYLTKGIPLLGPNKKSR